jgi:hypothetical protein
VETAVQAQPAVTTEAQPAVATITV